MPDVHTLVNDFVIKLKRRYAFMLLVCSIVEGSMVELF